MSNINVTRQGPEVMADNPSRVDVADYTTALREFQPPKTYHADWRTLVAKGALIGGGWLLAATTYGLWKNAPFVGYCADFQNYATCAALTQAEPAVFLGLPVVAAAVTVWQHITNTKADLRQKRAITTRTGLVLDRFGNQAPADLFDRMHPAALLDYLERRYAMDVNLKRETAVHERYWGVNSLSEGSTTSVPTGAVAGLLADGGLKVGPVAVAEWLPWLDEPPHLLLAAESGGGKSVLASVVVNGRVQRRGDTVAILDPHWSPMVEADEGRLVAKWGGIKPLATSHEEIRRALIDIRAEYDDRMEQLRNGEVVEGHFPPLTIIIDEVPEVVAELKKRDGRGQDTWGDTTQVLGSGARKVNISVILLTQSPLVEDIGLNSAMRKNFCRVALKHAEIGFLLKDEANQDRRKAVLAAVDGQRFPAAVLRDGQAWALDRNGLLGLMPQTINARAWGQADDGLTDNEDGLLAELLGTTGTTFCGAESGRITTPLEPVPAVPTHQDAVNGDDDGSAAKEAEVRTLARLTELSGSEIARKVGIRKERALELVREVRG